MSDADTDTDPADFDFALTYGAGACRVLADHVRAWPEGTRSKHVFLQDLESSAERLDELRDRLSDR